MTIRRKAYFEQNGRGYAGATVPLSSATTRRAILIVTAVAVASLATWGWRVWQLPTQRACRACAECADLVPSDVDSLIDIMRDNRLNREQCLELYRQHSTGPAADCEPCAVAVLDAAGK